MSDPTPPVSDTRPQATDHALPGGDRSREAVATDEVRTDAETARAPAEGSRATGNLASPVSRGFGIWVFAVVALGVVTLGVIFSSRLGTGPVLTSSPLVGKPAPSIELPYLEADGIFDLADLHGDIVVVNFWASWCTGCRIEHPGLLAASAAFTDFDVRFVGVLYQDRPAAGIGFLDELGRGEDYTYVVDGDSRVGLDFGVLGLPETFFIDREGTIVGKISGTAAPDLLMATVQRLVLGEAIGTITTGDLENRD